MVIQTSTILNTICNYKEITMPILNLLVFSAILKELQKAVE
jgi:hypothetical protein